MPVDAGQWRGDHAEGKGSQMGADDLIIVTTGNCSSGAFLSII
jgi:hypothetical protein